MPQFEVSTYPSQIFWLVICFVFLCAMMVWCLVPRLTAVMEGREQRLQQDRDQANLIRGKEEALKRENLARLAEARGKAHILIHQALTDAHNLKLHRMMALDEDLLAKTKKTQKELEIQIQKILRNIEPLVSQVVVATSQRVLGQSLMRSQVKEIVESLSEKQEEA